MSLLVLVLAVMMDVARLARMLSMVCCGCCLEEYWIQGIPPDLVDKRADKPVKFWRVIIGRMPVSFEIY